VIDAQRDELNAYLEPAVEAFYDAIDGLEINSTCDSGLNCIVGSYTTGHTNYWTIQKGLEAALATLKLGPFKEY
jgi:hypothetical protein